MQRPHLPAGVIFVSDASVSRDPIELAQGEISRSKDVVASVSKDLDQYDRWLKDFVASEKRSRVRHASRVKRQQARERRQLARQRLVRSGRRAALSVAVFVRSVFLSLRRGLAHLGHLTWQSAAWIALSTYALSAFLLKRLSSGVSWISARARSVALALLSAVSASSLWIAARAKALTVASARLLAASYAWMSAKAGALTRAALRAVSISFSWIAARVREAALASFNLLSLGSSWLAARGRALAIVSAGAATRVERRVTSGAAGSSMSPQRPMLSSLSVSAAFARAALLSIAAARRSV